MESSSSSIAPGQTQVHQALRATQVLLSALRRAAPSTPPDRSAPAPGSDADDLEFLRRLREAGL